MTTNPDNVGGLYGSLTGEQEASMRGYCMTHLRAVEAEYKDTGKFIRDWLTHVENERNRLFELCRAAPAGSVEVEALVQKWRDESESGFDGDGNLSDTWTAQAKRACADELAALLRKLQQGADYVMVPRDSAKMVTHVCSEWIDLFRAAPGIEKYERYSYEPAVEELRDEYAAIAASQGQEGGTNG